MGEVVAWLLITGLASVALVVGAAMVAVWRLRRRNRLHPAVPTLMPLAWLVSPARAARLHRRLRQAVVAAGWTGPPRRRRSSAAPGRVQELAGELVAEAVAVDHQLLTASLAPRSARRHLLDTVEPSIVRLERLAGRLAAMAVPAGRGLPGDPAGIDALEERVDVLESARREVDVLESLLRVPGDRAPVERLQRPA